MTALEEIKKALAAAEQFIANGVDLGYIRMPDPQTPDSAHDTLPMIRQAQISIESLQRENEELRDLTAHLRLQAQTHAMEARGANATIHEIYQIISGGKGEPGNWRGAKPVREYVEAAKGEILRLETELALSKPVYSRRQLEARAEAAEAEVKRLREALSAVLAAHDIKSVKGKLLEDVIASATERARTALASTGGEDHGN